MNGRTSELSPDVEPFVPRTDYRKDESGDGRDADEAKTDADDGQTSHPWTTQKWKTRKTRPRQDGDAGFEVGRPLLRSRPARGDGATNVRRPAEEDVSTRDRSRTQKTVGDASEEKKRRAFAKSTRFCGTEEKRGELGRRYPTPNFDRRLNVNGEFKTRFGASERGTESPNASRSGREELEANKPTNGFSGEIPFRRRTDDARAKKRSGFSKTVPSFNEVKNEFRKDAICENETASRNAEVGDDVRFGRKTTAAGGDAKRSSVPENGSESKEFKMIDGTATEENVLRKKKTDGQRKKEYKNKVKLLPSVRGKVSTVTHEFYNLVTRNEPEITRLLTKDDGAEEIRFGSNDFPALGDDLEDRKLARSFEKKCSAKESQDWDLQTDSDWSDVDPGENLSEICKTEGECKSAKATNAVAKKTRKLKDIEAANKSDEPESRSYAATVKKSNSPTKNPDHIKSSVGTNPRELLAKQKSQALKSGKEHSKKPKTKSLIEYDLIAMLNKNKNVSKDFHNRNASSSKEGKKTVKVKPVVANILDSSAPSRRRGKEREKPAKKKISAMKKIILREREAKKSRKNAVQMQQIVEMDVVPPASDGVSEEVWVVDVPEEKSDQNTDASVAASDIRKPAIHTRKFREYCNQMLNPEIDETVTKLIQDLIRFQDRLYQKDPIKAKMRRRIVVGLREVTKHLKLKKLKCIILAPNLEKIISDGGLDEAMRNIISTAVEQEVPFVFALGRRKLGRVCLKKVPVSSVGIFNYDGSEVNFKHLCTLATAAQEAYEEATRRGSAVR